MAGLEAPDDRITLARAAELAGTTPGALRQAALAGRLYATKSARTWLTTRRNLHGYLAGRRGVAGPLPPDYQTPEGEEPIG